MRVAQQNIVLRCFGGLSGLGGSRSLLSSGIGFGEALLPGLCFPVIVSDSATIFNDAASKLSEHGPGGNNGDLPRSVREGQDLLLDKVILFGLASDNFVERPILIKQEVRVSVSQHSGAFGGQHKELVSTVWNQECATPVLAVAKELAIGHHLLLTKLVCLARDVLVARRVELVSGMISHRGQRFEGRLSRRGLRR